MKWEELPLADRAQLMAAAVKNGYTDIRSIKAAYANFQNQRQQTGNRYDDGGEFEVVNPLDNVPVDDQEKRYRYFRSTLPENLQDDTIYRLRRAWELNGEPRTFSDAIAGDNPMFSYNLDDELYHGNSVAYNPNANEYEFLKPVDHDTVDLELMQYFNNPELEELRQNYQMDWDEDGSRGYYKYVPRTDDNALAYGGNLFKAGGNKQSKKDYYRQQLIIRGLRGAQLEAVLANMEVESGFNPKAYNKSSGAQGLMQWLGSRKPKSWSEKDQLDYIAATYNKFGGNEWLDKNAWKRFNETTDPAEAARLFRRYWERPEKSSWYATDKYFGKQSRFPQEVNDLVAQVSNLQYDEPKAPIFTEEDQRLLDTPALAFYNPEYEDTQAPDYKPSTLQESIKLDENLWKNPANGWALYNQFANMQQDSSQDDPLGWMTMMASLSPNTTPQQKEAASTMYQLFAPQDGDYSYHGLNFAAYGGKVNRFDDGGFSDLPEQRAYRRAVNLKAPYTNYEDAIDMDDSIMLRLKKFFDKGVSNCTLTASQLFNPNNPIGRARTIVNDSINNGFYEIDADHVVPGTMVIASHPNMSDYSPEQNYHTMVVTGFAPNDYEYTFRDGTKYQIKKGEPLVSYSRGKASADNYVHDIPLIVYNANSEGKTYNRYYRPIDENYPQVMIPEVTVVK